MAPRTAVTAGGVARFAGARHAVIASICSLSCVACSDQ